MIRSLRNKEPIALQRAISEINWQTVLLGLGLFVVFIAAMAAVQFSTPDMPDNDGYYHIRLAWLMRTEGLTPHFPYLPLTILNEREFYDHHFLFHVGLIPFTFGDLRLGAKMAAAFFAGLALFSIWMLLRAQRVAYSGLWSLGILAVSHAFLFRMSITRAQSLSLVVLILGIHWMLTGKHMRLLVLAFFYVWLYNAFPLLPVMALLYAIAVWLVERRLDLRPLLFTSIGVALGLVINPYFPVDIIFIFRHLLPKLADTTAVRVGNEWYPYTTRQLLENSLFSLVAFAAGALALGLDDRRMDVRTAFGLLLSLMAGLMLFQSRRFIEYFPPFALIFAAFAWSPLLGRAAAARESWLQATARLFPVLALAVLVIIGTMINLPAVSGSLQDSKPYGLYAGASAFLEDETEPGERIFQTDWDDFPRLFFYNTHNTYTVGLDPTYMQLYDSDLYDLWVQITQGQVENPSEVIVERFGAHYVHTDLNHGDFIQAADNDPAMEKVYSDDQAIIYRISP